MSAMERIGTDNKDRPVEDIVIESAQIFTDPYAEVDEKVTIKSKSIQSRQILMLYAYFSW